MVGYMDGWIYGWLDGWMYGWFELYTNGQTGRPPKFNILQSKEPDT